MVISQFETLCTTIRDVVWQTPNKLANCLNVMELAIYHKNIYMLASGGILCVPSSFQISDSVYQNKMKVIVKAYKTAMDNSRQTGVGVITVPFIKVMDEIFGDKPTVSNPFSAHVGNPPQCSIQQQQWHQWHKCQPAHHLQQ